MAAHRHQIAVHHLPSFSPELNPDERLNRSLKSKLGQLPAARDERSLHRQTLGQLRSCHRQSELIRSFFAATAILSAHVPGASGALKAIKRKS